MRRSSCGARRASGALWAVARSCITCRICLICGVPLGLYDCQGTRAGCAKIARIVKQLTNALTSLDEESDEHAKLSAVLTFIGTEGDDNGVTIQDTSLAPGILGQAAPDDTLRLDLKQITSSASKFERQNPQMAPGALTTAIGALALAHEARHELDFDRLWGGELPSTKSQVLRTELNANNVAVALSKGLMFQTPLWHRNMTPEQQNNAIWNHSRRSVDIWCATSGKCQ